MYRSIRIRNRLGAFFISGGSVMLICTLLFYFFGGFLIKSESVQFEPEQSVSTSQASVGTISIPGFDSMTIEAGSKSVSAYLYNPEKNNCYFEISIILSDTQEEIYKSKYISPGQTLYEIELDRPVEKGTYNAVLHYSTYSTDGYKSLNGANVPFVLEAA